MTKTNIVQYIVEQGRGYSLPCFYKKIVCVVTDTHTQYNVKC